MTAEYLGCFHAWIDAHVCPGNQFNRNPGIRHICARHDAEGRCHCPCGAVTKKEKETS